MYIVVIRITDYIIIFLNKHNCSTHKDIFKSENLEWS